jgi:hypothetical protein
VKYVSTHFIYPIEYVGIILVIFFTFFPKQCLAQAPDTLWTKTYGGVDREQVFTIKQLGDNCFAAVGFTASFGAGNFDVWLLKLDSLGDTLWTRTYGGLEPDVCYSLHQMQNGGYLLCGKTGSYGAGLYDLYLICTDSIGDTLWTKTYGGVNHDWGFSMQPISCGRFIIGGWTESFGAGN